jgi:hypothetical protein
MGYVVVDVAVADVEVGVLRIYPSPTARANAAGRGAVAIGKGQMMQENKARVDDLDHRVGVPPIQYCLVKMGIPSEEI